MLLSLLLALPVRANLVQPLEYCGPEESPSLITRGGRFLRCEWKLLTKATGVAVLGSGLFLGAHLYSHREVRLPSEMAQASIFNKLAVGAFDPLSDPQLAREAPVLPSSLGNRQRAALRLKTNTGALCFYKSLLTQSTTGWVTRSPELYDRRVDPSQDVWDYESQRLERLVRRLPPADQELLLRAAPQGFDVSLVEEDGRLPPLLVWTPHQAIRVRLPVRERRTLGNLLSHERFADRLEIDLVDESAADAYLKSLVVFLRSRFAP